MGDIYGRVRIYNAGFLVFTVGSVALAFDPHVLAALTAHNAATLTGKQFVPELISTPFHDGLVIVFSLAIAMALVAAVASLLRGERYVHQDEQVVVQVGGDDVPGSSPAAPPATAPHDHGRVSSPTASS